MKNRRLTIAGLALAAALGLAGCGTDSDNTASNGPSAGGSASAAAPAAGTPEAAAELVAAATKLGESSMKIDSKVGDALSTTGTVDPKAGKVKTTMVLGVTGSATKVELIQIANDMYMKFTGPLAKVVGASWLHIDATKLKAGNSFNQLQNNDPAGAQAMAKAMANVQKTGDRDFKGTLDLTKTPQYNKDSLKAMGAKASAVPFTAKTDVEGRLVELTLDLQTVMAGAGTMKTTFSDFGTTVDVAKPAGARELPPEMQSLLNA